MNNIFYLNLTNGLLFKNKFNNIKFIRIQSSLLERKKWDKVLADLDYQFLLDIAKGNNINVIDGSVNSISRALWQGIPWIEYVLNRIWLNKEIKPLVRNKCNCLEYFRKLYKYNITKQTKRKLRYIKNFINNDLKEVKINKIYFKIKKEIPIEELKNEID